jgi:hypothetical protein
MTYDPQRDVLPEHLVRPAWPSGPRPDPKSIRAHAIEVAARIALAGTDAYAIAVVSEAWRIEFGFYGSMNYLGHRAVERVEAARRGRYKAKLRHEAEGFLRAVDMLIAAPAPALQHVDLESSA